MFICLALIGLDPLVTSAIFKRLIDLRSHGMGYGWMDGGSAHGGYSGYLSISFLWLRAGSLACINLIQSRLPKTLIHSAM